MRLSSLRHETDVLGDGSADFSPVRCFICDRQQLFLSGFGYFLRLTNRKFRNDFAFGQSTPRYGA